MYSPWPWDESETARGVAILEQSVACTGGAAPASQLFPLPSNNYLVLGQTYTATVSGAQT